MMRRAMVCVGVITLFLIFNSGRAVAASDPAYQEKLEKEMIQIDLAVEKAGGIVGPKLSSRFKVEPTVIQEIRDEGLQWEVKAGWGEISILMSLARELAKSHPVEYPGYLDALKKVRGLRAENLKYEEMAKQLELNLNPVLAEVRNIRTNLQANKRPGN